MPSWIYEAGIGENRAILIEDGEIVEAAIEWPDQLSAGSVVEARLDQILIPGLRAIVAIADQYSALLEPLPRTLTEGQAIRVEVVRETIFEKGRTGMKNAKVRATDAELRTGPTLHERLLRTGYPVKSASSIHGDALESSGWSELLDEAEQGQIEFEGGMLQLALTPAMALFDVDGFLPPAALAIAGARAAGQSIRRLAMTGSIGIDLPTLSSREDRQKAAAALDEVLPQPFERTAVNGFGFLQIVRKRERASIPELVQGDPAGAEARALLRRAERTGGSGERTIRAAPSVIHAVRPDWQRALERRIGAPIVLRPDPTLAISGGHVQSANP